ncbi:nitrite/sulfite reductase [Aliamphritea spongicola]|uniref:nitrite/sulfite reductase n=1 Tax=Aliamphritea spongicola TaxID=707589 RepID=UPI00196A5E27|nr:nitrite/sulfite reductase [Aliamphritea spongicola]MBN3562239.1 nitrite/sulfite reductase [Aliamphritea spongicola]
MYQYDELDRQVVNNRVQQFRGQMSRYLSGELSEEAFLPLRLQNGLYIQKHAPMLRVAVPYGMLSAAQMRCMAEVCDRYDRGYCHITTRQNVQFNWVKMEDVADILDTLASVEMHAIQTSGNCIRNTTSDPLAGVAADEQTDPRPYCEIIRQWSSLHPEFAFLPRKFKIAVIGAAEDRASIQLHDVGLQLVTNADGETGFKVWVGGGLGRTPMLATLIRAFLPQAHLLGYLKAVLRVYNRYGRRDNKYKARIKILVNSLGAADFSAQVEAEFQRTNSEEYWLTDAELAHARSFFTEPAYEQLNVTAEAEAPDSPAYRHWLRRNVREHRVAGYAIVTLSLKHQGTAPGDITSEQLRRVADLAEQFSFGEARNTQQQNIVLADVKRSDLFALWQEACRLELAAPTIGTLSDVVCCPGGDFCGLANARSLPINSAIQQRFDDLDYLYDLGDLSLRISGCINACAHHHIANIGILGVDKKGEEFYQLTLGGEVGERSRIGKVLGPSIPLDAVPDALEAIVDVFVEQRHEEEPFILTYERIGKDKFKERVYATGH